MHSMVTHSLAGVSMASVSMAGKDDKPKEPVVPSNEIWYTTTDGAIITPNSTSGMPTGKQYLRWGVRKDGICEGCHKP